MTIIGPEERRAVSAPFPGRREDTYMKRILSVDGGGTKLNAILLDENMTLIGRGTSGGVNSAQNTGESILHHVNDCLDQVFSGGVPPVLDAVYVIYVGDGELFRRELERRVPCLDFRAFGESTGAVLAGSLTDRGLVALSGTGSYASYVSPDTQIHIGGRGPIAGDEGGGVWMGQQVVHAVMRCCDGWGEPTRLAPMLLEHWNCGDDPTGIVLTLAASGEPYRKLASLTRLLGRAAQEGDGVALKIVREAGTLLAEQMLALIRRLDFPPERMDITLCGGAWKTHPDMMAAFLERLRTIYPEVQASMPLFEHVCFGAVRWLLDTGMGSAEILRLLSEQLPDYVIRK